MEHLVARSWKLLVAVAAVIGAYGFFAPFYAYPDVQLEITAWHMLVGYESLDDIRADHAGVADEDVDTEVGRKRFAELNTSIKSDYVSELAREGTIAGDSSPRRNRIPLYFGAVALLACIAIYALVEGKLSTNVAWLVVIAGLVALWGMARSWRMIGGNPTVELAQGAYLLALSGGLALVSGVGALMREDPGGIFRTRAPIDDDGDIDDTVE